MNFIVDFHSSDLLPPSFEMILNFGEKISRGLNPFKSFTFFFILSSFIKNEGFVSFYFYSFIFFSDSVFLYHVATSYRKLTTSLLLNLQIDDWKKGKTTREWKHEEMVRSAFATVDIVMLSDSVFLLMLPNYFWSKWIRTLH